MHTSTRIQHLSSLGTASLSRSEALVLEMAKIQSCASGNASTIAQVSANRRAPLLAEGSVHSEGSVHLDGLL